ncbi:MAG: SDR family oxidoreductase [Chloroflexi bacterium]|nr:SDR family oxidoreductase [Chloroflexota bacterium]
MPRSLVTGGAGFIGSHLCERLVAAGHDVVCVDNFITGRSANVQHLAGQKRFTLLESDIRKPLHVPGRLDHIFHLASLASPKDYVRHPLETLEAGSIGSTHTLELARNSGATFLFTSSSEVYGDPLVHPQREDYWGNVNPNGPRSMYDESKRFGEAIAMAYHRQYGVSIRIARIFNTYGPRMRIGDGRVIPAFVTQALQERPLTVYGDGTQTRSLCYVDDTVEALFLLGTKTFPKDVQGVGLVINIGNPNELTMLDLARLVLKATGSKSPIIHEPLPEDDPKKRRPDISRARASLSWEPRVPLREGIKSTIPYFKAASMTKAS